MIFNITNAGGKYGGFNFSVVPYASESELPEFADENTIAIIPKSEMSSWIFSMTEPPNPTDGMVWIAIGKSGTAEINIIKENAVMLYPLYAKQYVNGAWVNISALSYNADGEQVKWMSDIILYDNGATDIGWEKLDKKKASIPEDKNYINLTLAKDGNAYVRTLVNLSGQEKLKVVYSNLTGESSGTTSFQGGVRAKVWDKDGKEIEGAGYQTESTGSSGTPTLDISKLNGEYMVGVYVINYSSSHTGSCRVESIKVLMRGD
jgi:hypothetical protein